MSFSRWMLSSAAAAGLLCFGSVAPATAGDARAGRSFAAKNCAACHAIGRSGASANPKAPPFRVIARRYQPTELEESLAEGIVTGHGAMPEFTLSPRQIDDLIAHLRLLRRGG
jgi:cytochrome c